MIASAPRWPANATLLREVLTWARAEGWRPAPNRAHPASDATPIIGAWTRGPAGEYGLGDEYVCFVRDLGEISEDVSGPGLFGDLCDGVPVTSVTQAVDLLVALKVLPVALSSAYRQGHAEGVQAVEEAALETRFDVYLDELWGRLKDSDVLAGIGRELDGVLDRETFVRRRQVERVVNVVLAAAGMGDDA
jgi:hypothetical protein